MTKELDKKIGKEETDQDGRKFKMINGRKIYQASQKTERERLINQAINRIRASRT
jgi:hypothetical protein